MSESKKICVVMGDDRPVLRGAQTAASYPSLAYEINRRFCAARGWDFRYERYVLPERPWGTWTAYSRAAKQHRAASWVKVLAVLRAFDLGYDVVVWIDSDCIFYDHNADWTDLMSAFDASEVHFLSWVDRPFYTDQFCAGFFAIRSSELTQKLLQDLWVEPSAYSWKHVYEQSELNARVRQWPRSMYSLVDEPMFRLEVPNQKLLHVASFDHQRRVPDFLAWFAERSIAPEAQHLEDHVHTDLDVEAWDSKLAARELNWSERFQRDVWSVRQGLRAQLKRLLRRLR